MAWYRVIHELIPTNERLPKIHLAPTDSCRHCALKDTLEHRLAACGEGRDIWDYSKSLLAQMLQTVPNRIPDEWLMHPQFTMWPPKRRRAILWIMANVIHFRTQQRWHLTLQDFMDFMLRSRWKLTQTKRGRESVGNYLKVMDMGMEQVPPPPVSRQCERVPSRMEWDEWSRTVYKQCKVCDGAQTWGNFALFSTAPCRLMNEDTIPQWEALGLVCLTQSVWLTDLVIV
jgi:hypothetical protein